MSLASFIQKCKNTLSDHRKGDSLKEPQQAQFVFSRRIPLPQKTLRPLKRSRFPWKEKMFQKIGVAVQTLEKSTGFTLGGILLVTLILGWMFVQKVTKIPLQNITIESTDSLVDKELAYRSLADVDNYSFFQFSAQQLLRTIAASQANIQSVQIDRIFPDKATIILSSYPKIFRSEGQEKNGVITSNGILIFKTNKEDAHLPLLQVILPEDKILGKQVINYRRVLSEQDTQKIVDTLRLLAEKFPLSPVKSVAFFSLEREIHIQTEKTLILLDLEQDSLDPALSLLRLYANRKNDPLQSGIWTYADLRIPGKIFACPSEKSKECFKNLSEIYGDFYRPKDPKTPIKKAP